MEDSLYRAKKITDGEYVIGSLLHIPNSPFLNKGGRMINN